MAYEDLKSLDFGNIYGAGTGGVQDLSKLIEALYGTLAKAGYMGTDFQEEGGTPSFITDPVNTHNIELQGKEYTIDNLITGMTDTYGEKEGDFDKGMMSLVGLLKQFQSKDVAGGYSQDWGSISTEIGSQLASLTKGYGLSSKGGRYENLATGGKQIGQGTREAYTSDYYSLIDEQNEMRQDLQQKTTEQFMGNVGQWMTLHPSVSTSS